MPISELPLLCPECQADLSRLPVDEHGNGPAFCLKCRFPLLLVADKYRLTGILGEGGFSLVYKAVHTRLERRAERVVKVIKPEIFSSVPSMERRFLREVQVTCELSERNQHIVRVYDDFGEIPSLGHYYVMEFLDGKPLAEYLKDPDDLPAIEWSIHVFEQLCAAMQPAHDEGVIHRDLKPENLILVRGMDDPDFLKVLDFGIAKPVGDDGRKVTQITQGILGTPPYMSPEQCANRDPDARSDIYAMGIILYEMLTGAPPFTMEEYGSLLEVMMAHMGKEPLPPRRKRPDRGIGEPLEQVVLRCLAKRTDDRYQSVREVRAALSSARPRQATMPLGTVDPAIWESSPPGPDGQVELDPVEEDERTTEPDGVPRAPTEMRDEPAAVAPRSDPGGHEQPESARDEAQDIPIHVQEPALSPGPVAGGPTEAVPEARQEATPAVEQPRTPIPVERPSPPVRSDTMAEVSLSLTTGSFEEPLDWRGRKKLWLGLAVVMVCLVGLGVTFREQLFSHTGVTTAGEGAAADSGMARSTFATAPTSQGTSRPGADLAARPSPPPDRDRSGRNGKGGGGGAAVSLRTGDGHSGPKDGRSAPSARRKGVRILGRARTRKVARAAGARLRRGSALEGRSRRKRRRRRAARRAHTRSRRSRCPRWAPTFVAVAPKLDRRAEVAVERGRIRRIRGGFCVPTNAGRISLEQRGFADCIFSLPRTAVRRKVLLKREDGSFRPATYCLRR